MKKLFAIALAMLLVFSAVPMVVVADDTAVTIPTTTWEDEGNYDSSWYVGHEADTTYEIDSAAKLAGLLKMSRSDSFKGKTIYITADIDLAGHKWTAIGSEAKAFEGLLEGKKGGVEGAAVTISNLRAHHKSRAGFLSRHATGGVKNLTFDNAYVQGSGYSGIVSGDVRLATGAYVAENITIKNSSVNTEGGTVVGIMFGCVNLWGLDVTMKNLTVVNSSIVGVSEVGALIGRATWGTMSLDSCVVADCDIDARGYAGGVVGWTDMPLTVSNTYVSGNIFTDSVDKGFASAFVGFVQSGKTMTFTDCQSDALVYSKNGNVGSFFGGVNTAKTGHALVATNCVSTGLSKGLNGFNWIAADADKVAVTATNCYSVMQTKFTETAKTQYMALGTALEGLDFTTTWKIREGKYPVLAIAETYAKDTYATADLSWFTPDVADAKYTLTTEAQVVGLGLLSHVCSPMDYDIATDSAVQGKLSETGLIAPEFLAGYDPAGTSAPKAEGIDGVRSSNENWKSEADLVLNQMALFVNNPTVWAATNGTELRIFVEVPVDDTYKVLNVNLIVNVDPATCTTAMNDTNGFGKVVSGTFTGEGKAGSMTWNGGTYSLSDALGLSSANYIVKNEDGKWCLEVKYALPENAKTALTTGSYEIEVDAAVTYTNGLVNYCKDTNAGGFDLSGNSASAVLINVDPSAIEEGEVTTPGTEDDTATLPNDDVETTDDETPGTSASEPEKKGCKSNVESTFVWLMIAMVCVFVVVTGKKNKARNH